MTASPDHALAALARGQHGVFSASQAVALGMTRSTVQRRLEAGRYTDLWPGILCEAALPTTWDSRALAAVMFVGGEAALARRAAARLLGLDTGSRPDEIHVVVRDRVFPGVRGIRVHRTNQLPESDVTSVRAIRVTVPERTLADTAASGNPTGLRRQLAQGVRTGTVDPTALRAHLRRRGRLRGKRHLLRLLDELSPLEATCRNEFESRFLRLMRRADLEPTAMNHPVVDVRGRDRQIDAVWLPERLPVELQSQAWHGSMLDANDDVQRENDIVLDGQWRSFLRFTWWDVTERGDEVVAIVRAALRAANARDRMSG